LIAWTFADFSRSVEAWGISKAYMTYEFLRSP
jgi:hypothetical protein